MTASRSGANAPVRRWAQVVDRAVLGITLIAVHEADALAAHWTELGERLEVARRARGPRQLIREQLDLLPESHSRLRHDQQIRRQLWRGLWRDLSAVTAAH
ncbi:MAG TPA: hypothetical protein VHE37_12710 [Nevskiaceae bacterium]|nr:hypothetical protein [Nevskiaceae bacterium]